MTWIDSFHTRMFESRGTYDKGSDSFTFEGSFFDAVADKDRGEFTRPWQELVDREPGSKSLQRAAERFGDRGDTGLSDLDNAEGLGFWKVQFWLFWGVLALFAVLFKSYALYILIGGSASLYQILRSDVDGTDDDEIFLEDGDPDVCFKAKEALARFGKDQ